MSHVVLKTNPVCSEVIVDGVTLKDFYCLHHKAFGLELAIEEAHRLGCEVTVSYTMTLLTEL